MCQSISIMHQPIGRPKIKHLCYFIRKEMIYSRCRSLRHCPKCLRIVFTLTQSNGYKCQSIGQYRFCQKNIQKVLDSTDTTSKKLE